jgi:hypothetical protein
MCNDNNLRIRIGESNLEGVQHLTLQPLAARFHLFLCGDHLNVKETMANLCTGHNIRIHASRRLASFVHSRSLTTCWIFSSKASSRSRSTAFAFSCRMKHSASQQPNSGRNSSNQCEPRLDMRNTSGVRSRTHWVTSIAGDRVLAIFSSSSSLGLDRASPSFSS